MTTGHYPLRLGLRKGDLEVETGGKQGEHGRRAGGEIIRESNGEAVDSDCQRGCRRLQRTEEDRSATCSLAGK